MTLVRVLIALLTAAVVAVTVLAASGVFGKGAATAKAAPACLPSTPAGSAKLARVPVTVSPAPGSVTANPRTQISFLGAPSHEIHEVLVSAQRSGRHPGALRPYSQGDGASFIPNSPFEPGERVQVQARIGPGEGSSVSFSFRVDTPYSTASVPEFPNPAAPSADYQSFATLPGVQAPVLSVTSADRDPSAGDVLTTNGPGAGRYGPLIYTPQGTLVWFDQLPPGSNAENLSVQRYEGQRDLTFWQGRVLSLGFGQGEDLVLNDHYQTIARVKGGNGLAADLHDFQIAGDHVSYTTAFNPIRCDLSSVEGPRDGTIVDTSVQEIDMRTGLVRWEWHSLDHIGVQESQTSPPKSSPWDWFHINSIDVQPDGDILISARSTWAAYQLAASTGQVLWRLGGSHSSFTMGAGTRTAWQHDARILANGEVTLFDDGSNPPVHAQSRGVRVRLDFKRHTALVSAAYTHDPPVLSASQGNMQTLSDGSAVVDYGGVPQLSEYAANGALLFDAHLPLEMSSYRGFRFPWSGRPLYPPRTAASFNNTGEETIVRASWNGASEVTAWRVLAGGSPGALTPSTTFPSSGFESSTILTKRYAYVAVRALDARGHVLGTSPAARVSPYGQLNAGGGQK